MAEHPSPPSSPGSNKRIADSDIISDLVRSAKASRYNNQLPMQDNDEFGDKSERDLACAICSEIMAHPVACLDCVHIFCGEFRGGEMSGIELTIGVNEGSCLVPWFQRSDTCPTCRQTVRGTTDSHFTISTIETFLSRFPDKKRDPDELKELELVYRPGQKVLPPPTILSM